MYKARNVDDFMEQKVRKRLPIVTLIDAINNAHKKGFVRD